MWKKLLRFLNPMAQLGKKTYSIRFPLLITIFLYILSELFAYLVLKNPDAMGTPDVILTFLLVIYFAFRSGIKGGLTVAVLSVIFFTYFIYTRHASFSTKEAATVVALSLTVVYFILALILGWLRQTIDKLLDREMQARLEAEHGQRRLQILLQQLPVGVMIAKAPAGEISTINERALKILGHSATKKFSLEEYRRLGAYSKGKLLSPNEWPLAAALLRGKTVVDKEIVLTNKKRKKITLFANAAPIRDKKGKIIAAVSTFYDITQQKELERQKDDFIGMASHELRTPLTSSKMYAQLFLKEYANDPKATLLVSKMDAQLSRLTSLVMTMLDTTRIAQGKLVIEKKLFILKDSALETLADLQEITKRKIKVDWRTNEYILGNEERLRQVFTNLVTNAIKYSPNNTDIVVNSRKKGKTIVVSVQDFGTGISKEEQKHIFDRFYQAEQHKTYAGLGLGLYISSEIINQHGGEMWLDSAKGKGTTFYFSLPIYKSKG